MNDTPELHVAIAGLQSWLDHSKRNRPEIDNHLSGSGYASYPLDSAWLETLLEQWPEGIRRPLPKLPTKGGSVVKSTLDGSDTVLFHTGGLVNNPWVTDKGVFLSVDHAEDYLGEDWEQVL